MLVVNISMYLIYHIELPFFERYRISSEPWPWYENREEWMALLKKSMKLVAFNAFVSYPLALVVSVFLANFDIKYDFDPNNLPDMKTIMMSVTFCMVCEDFFFYISHRLLHTKLLYPYIHKIHHTHRITTGIAAEYAHPIEFILGNMIPFASGPFILGKNIHLYTVMVWGVLRMGETLDGHSGYDFSWSPYRLIPFSTSARYHSFHHSHNIGNYSSFFSLWDTCFSSN
jgi:sterol desaturase/sphingolipid hydroxylase (fatty acid hydroxylase superfamily)